MKHKDPERDYEIHLKDKEITSEQLRSIELVIKSKLPDAKLLKK
jgi:hypothetical protein